MYKYANVTASKREEAEISKASSGVQGPLKRVTGFQGATKRHQFDSRSNIKRPPIGVNKWMLKLVGTHCLARGSEMPTQPCNERNCCESNVKLVIKLSGLVTLQTSGHLRALSRGYLYSLHLQTPCDCCNDGIKSSPSCGISILSF